MLLLLFSIVKFDVETDMPVRVNGLCVQCKPGETGEMLGKIVVDPAAVMFSVTLTLDHVAQFGLFTSSTCSVDDKQGYTDRKATDKKILKDVFKPGDQYFRTGDLLMMDSEGYYYFQDRIGDTFRYKGENVATTEVKRKKERMNE